MSKDKNPAPQHHLVGIGHQHRVRMKKDTASWSDWTDGRPNFSTGALDYLEVQEREIFVLEGDQ